MQNDTEHTRPTGRRPDTVAGLLETMQQMFAAPAIDAARAFPLRPTDIVIATFPKCGTTWMQQIVHGLRTGGSMDFEEISSVIPFMELAPLMELDLHAPQVAEPRAFKTHLAWDDAPRGGRYIYVMRDPGDALVSLYHFLNGSIFERDAISIEAVAEEVFMPGALASRSYWANLRSWWAQRDAQEVLYVCYEDMKADLAGAVRRVARFMGLDADQALLEVATRQASYEFMRQHVHQFDDHVLQGLMEKAQDLPPGKPLEKVRAGETGSRDRELSADTRAALDAMWQRELAEPLGLRSYDELRAQVAALADT